MAEDPSSVAGHLVHMAGSFLTAQRHLDDWMRARRNQVRAVLDPASGIPLVDDLIDSMMPGGMQIQRATIELGISLVSETTTVAGAYLEVPLVARHSFYEHRYSVEHRSSSTLTLDLEALAVRTEAVIHPLPDSMDTGANNG